MEQQHKYRQQLQYKYRHAGGVEGETGGGCTFCGAPLDNDERFCPDCGNPRGGITCPRCGTVSHRSFCSRCNTPLNELAREAVKQAKADPAFRRAEQLAAEMAELEGQILNAGMPEARLDTTPNHEARKAAGRYADLFAGVTSLKVPPPLWFSQAPQEKYSPAICSRPPSMPTKRKPPSSSAQSAQCFRPLRPHLRSNATFSVPGR